MNRWTQIGIGKILLPRTLENVDLHISNEKNNQFTSDCSDSGLFSSGSSSTRHSRGFINIYNPKWVLHHSNIIIPAFSVHNSHDANVPDHQSIVVYHSKCIAKVSEAKGQHTISINPVHTYPPANTPKFRSSQTTAETLTSHIVEQSDAVVHIEQFSPFIAEKIPVRKVAQSRNLHISNNYQRKLTDTMWTQSLFGYLKFWKYKLFD
jgi:hypothetical protein